MIIRTKANSVNLQNIYIRPKDTFNYLHKHMNQDQSNSQAYKIWTKSTAIPLLNTIIRTKATSVYLQNINIRTKAPLNYLHKYMNQDQSSTALKLERVGQVKKWANSQCRMYLIENGNCFVRSTSYCTMLVCKNQNQWSWFLLILNQKANIDHVCQSGPLVCDCMMMT